MYILLYLYFYFTCTLTWYSFIFILSVYIYSLLNLFRYWTLNKLYYYYYKQQQVYLILYTNYNLLRAQRNTICVTYKPKNGRQRNIHRMCRNRQHHPSLVDYLQKQATSSKSSGLLFMYTCFAILFNVHQIL